jgi:hypothetical protein
MLTESEIKILKVAKVKTQKSLLFYTRYFFKKRFNRKFIVNTHHEIICNALEKVISGELKRLIINIAPRYGKTEVAVKNMISHCLALNASAKFIHLSYSDDLALDNSEEIKDIILSDSYQELFPNVQLKKDSKSKKKWYTTAGGGVYATSASGQVTGFGAGKVDEEEENDMEEFLTSIEQKEEFGGAIIIDDPIKPDDADSETQRNKVNNKFDSTIRNRVNSPKNTPIIIIMQRLHEDDLAGYVTKQEPDDWHVISLPCIKDDEALWEFKHSVEDLNKLKKINPVVFERQYMQNPMPLEGVLFPYNKLQRFSLKKFNNQNVEGKIAFIDAADKGKDFYSMPVAYICNTGYKLEVYIVRALFTQDNLTITQPRTIEIIQSENLDYTYLETNKEGSIYYSNLREACPNNIIIGIIAKGKKETRILMQSGYIMDFYFLEDDEQDDEYRKFFYQLTHYMKEVENQPDDAPDSLAGLSKAIRIKFGHLIKF